MNRNRTKDVIATDALIAVKTVCGNCKNIACKTVLYCTKHLKRVMSSDVCNDHDPLIQPKGTK